MANVIFFSKFQNRVQGNEGSAKAIDALVFGKKMGIVAKLFGCWHDNLSRPFTQGKTAYRSCLHCGARKQFNAETLETFGSFYAPPLIRDDGNG